MVVKYSKVKQVYEVGLEFEVWSLVFDLFRSSKYSKVKQVYEVGLEFEVYGVKYSIYSVVVKYSKVTSGRPRLDAPSDWRPGGRGFNPRRGRQHSFVETDHEIFSTVILSLPLIQEGQLSVSGERMCTIQVNRLED